jgi:3-hydroxy acid dehydrogenase/malonic semialdehyde reductase
MNRLFSSKIILITGASSGFGEATARLFAKEGASLILIARRQEKLTKLAIELNELYGTKTLPLALDVSNYTEISEALSTLPSPFTVPDILINNAGMVRGMGKLWEVTHEEWNEMIETNVKGVLNVSRMIIPKMIESNKGHVINVGSTSSHECYPGGGVYCATKHAVKALTDTLRMELVATPIRVSLISPGMAETEFSKVRFYGNEEKAKNIYDGIQPLTAEDVAQAIVFMASRPLHVNIADMILYPKQQASPTIIHRKK